MFQSERQRKKTRHRFGSSSHTETKGAADGDLAVTLASRRSPEFHLVSAAVLLPVERPILMQRRAFTAS